MAQTGQSGLRSKRILRRLSVAPCHTTSSPAMGLCARPAGRFDSVELGRSTFDAVNHGVLFGVVSAVRAMQSDYADFEITLTGGGAQMLAHQLQGVSVDEDLLITGMTRYFGV